ncbi:MAG TPA: tetratricopeptide repeat protein [Polyangia bacterium]|jgi:hypothetical protein
MRRDCRSELPSRARRATLSPADTLAFEAHRAGCESCRDDHAILSAFADPETVDIEDGSRLQRLAATARQWTVARHGAGRGRRAASRPLRTLSVAAALILFASSASAAVWWWRRPAPSQTGQNPQSLASGRPVAPRSAPAEIAAPPPPRAEVSPVDRPPSRRPASAALLLQQAGNARRAGDATRATGLYRRLQHDFPGTSEAVLAAVPLATLLREGGFPGAALVEFDRYLTAAHGGGLIPEALYGRARALAALGDRPEEQRTWQRLLDDFPNSSYVPFGRRRLAELR